MNRVLKAVCTAGRKLAEKLKETTGEAVLHSERQADQMFGGYPDVVTVEQMAEMLCIGRTMAYSLIAANKVRCVRIGNRIRIPKPYIIEYIDRYLT